MKIAIIGYSGHSYGIIETIRSNGDEIIGYFDTSNKEDLYGLLYLGIEEIETHGYNLFVSIGDNKIRKSIFSKVKALNNLDFYIADGSSNISDTANIGIQSYIGKNTLLNSFSRIGVGCIINSNVVIEHECKIGNFTHIAPSSTICGNVTVGDNCLIGANSTILPNITIGNNVIIGAGSVVLNNIESNSKYVGNPARKL